MGLCVMLGITQPIEKNPPPAPAKDPFAEVRGMTISCHGSGRSWGTDAMVETIRDLQSLGVNWISIHPYAAIRADGRVGARYQQDPADPPDWLTRPIQEAHALGMKVLIKPHLAYWGSPFAWRGDITFQTADEWERFFVTYEAWITALAEICADADAFAVGTELDQTIQHATPWRSIIAAVRTKFAGPLTYAANWDQYQTVPFWDALDVIGIQAYFPVMSTPDPDADPIPVAEDWPTVAELDANWATIMTELRAYSKSVGKKISFTELGYNESAKTPYQPWATHSGGAHAQAIQARCLDRALAAIAAEPVVSGPFLWKWFPGNSTRGSFAQARPHTRAVIVTHWQNTN